MTSVKDCFSFGVNVSATPSPFLNVPDDKILSMFAYNINIM
jgi:hypothetical protein